MRLTISNFARIVVLLLALSLFSGTGHATVTVYPWVHLFKGIDHARGEADAAESRPQKVNALRIDLNDPDVQLFGTPSNGAAPLETFGQTTSTFLTTYGLRAAVNASFFSPVTSIPNDPRDLLGLCISQGISVSPPESGTFSTALMVTHSNQASIVTTTSNTVPATNIYTAITGAEYILKNGVNLGVNTDINPRTLCGLSQDKRYLILITVDGRQTGYSEGVNHFESAQWLQRFGAYNGFILDGGGSTAMVMSDGASGATQLNRPIDGGIPGHERVVGNNLGVIAPFLPDVIVTAVDWSPANLVTGTRLVFRATVKNQGTGPTPTGVILGVGFLVDGIAASWTDKYTNALAPGASITLTADGGPNGTNVWVATAGSHTVTATVDDIGRFSETDETNNVRTTTFIINTPPVLATIGNKTINAGGMLIFTNHASDSDIPAQILSFSLDPGAPAGAGIGAASGVFSWMAPQVASPQTNNVSIRVTDNGTPVLSDAKTFSIVVVPAPRVSSITTVNGNINLTWQTYPGKTYRLEYKNNVTDQNWTSLGSDIVASGYSLSVSNAINANPQRFYRVIQLD
jgi:Phosphodiester glycosidase/CARDB